MIKQHLIYNYYIYFDWVSQQLNFDSNWFENRVYFWISAKSHNMQEVISDER